MAKMYVSKHGRDTSSASGCTECLLCLYYATFRSSHIRTWTNALQLWRTLCLWTLCLATSTEGLNYLYYNCTSDCRILRTRQKKYENLVNMKNPSYTWQKKYENLVLCCLLGEVEGQRRRGQLSFLCLCYDPSTSISIFDHNWRHSGFIILF